MWNNWFRYSIYLDWVEGIQENEGGLEKFTQAYKEYGMHVLSDGTIQCKEWAPGAQALYLTGDFSNYKIFKYLLIVA